MRHLCSYKCTATTLRFLIIKIDGVYITYTIILYFILQFRCLKGWIFVCQDHRNGIPVPIQVKKRHKTCQMRLCNNHLPHYDRIILKEHQYKYVLLLYYKLNLLGPVSKCWISPNFHLEWSWQNCYGFNNIGYDFMILRSSVKYW